ncbi:MAG: response regulator [Endomicrobiales bacterium]|jgi:two-component system sensor histidine kinase/response regulator
MIVAEKSSGTSQERILIVDDDDTLRKTMSRLFEKKGFTVNSACSGTEGLNRIREMFYDIIVLDIRMPEMDGIEFLRKMRQIQDDPDCINSYVIITTGYASENVPVEALKLGADDYIRKPFELPDFVHSVEQNLKLLRAEKAKRDYVKKLAEKNEELKIALDKLTEMQEELVSSERFKTATRLASYMGHSLRNPLTTIKNVEYIFKNMAKQDKVDIKKFTEFVTLLSTGTQAADNILTSLLLFSDDIELHLNTVVDLPKLVDAAFDGITEKNSVQLIKNISPQSNEVFVDSEKMKLVFSNLFTYAMLPVNAANKITVTAEQTGAMVKISVADNGKGIDRGALQHIFEPVFDTTTEGTFFGLPLARSIIEKHKGKIEVESIEGKGTTFTFTLPSEKTIKT